MDAAPVDDDPRPLITSDEGRVVPAAFGARRFAALDVGTGRPSDRAFVKAMCRRLDEGGRGGPPHVPPTFDPGTVNPRQILKPTALLGQRPAAAARPPPGGWTGSGRARTGRTTTAGGGWSGPATRSRTTPTTPPGPAARAGMWPGPGSAGRGAVAGHRGEPERPEHDGHDGGRHDPRGARATLARPDHLARREKGHRSPP